jgi:hypothetical protein
VIALLLVLGAVVMFVITLVLVTVKDLISQELRGWLELVPAALLRLVVATRIPADQREELYEQDWLPELIYHLRKAEGRPITRLVVGIKYSVCLFRSARTVASDLRELSSGEEASAVSIPPDPPPAPLLLPNHVEAKAGAAGATAGAAGAAVLRGSGGTLSGTSVTKAAAYGSFM